MAVEVVCPSCGKQVRVRSALLGRMIRCSGCESTFIPKAPSSNMSDSRVKPRLADPTLPESSQETKPWWTEELPLLGGSSTTSPALQPDALCTADNASSGLTTSADPRESLQPGRRDGPAKVPAPGEGQERTRPAGKTPSNPNLPLFIGRFEIRARLGCGAFSTVYRAYDPQAGGEVALKVPLAAVMENPKAVERFMREGRAAAQLLHPNIVRTFEAGHDGSQYYIASAIIHGQTLSRAHGDDFLEFRRVARIVRQLAEALAHAHGRGIVHRDVKPANVMIDDEDKVHLMDFGLAHLKDMTEQLTDHGAVLGTPAYMAPEQARGKSGEALPASDQYSLGVILYELLCGELPFSGGRPEIVIFNVIHKDPTPPRSRRKDIPADLETICLKAMQKRPEDRYPSCREMSHDLRWWLQGKPIRGRCPRLIDRLSLALGKKPRLVFLALIGGLILVAVLVLAVTLML